MEFYTLFMANVDTNMQATVCCRENVTLREAFAIASLDILRHIKVNGRECRASQKLAECVVTHGGLTDQEIDAFVVTYGSRA